MTKAGGWSATAPLHVHFLVSTAIFGLVGFLLMLGIDRQSAWLWLAGAPVYGVLSTLVIARRRRRDREEPDTNPASDPIES